MFPSLAVFLVQILASLSSGFAKTILINTIPHALSQNGTSRQCAKLFMIILRYVPNKMLRGCYNIPILVISPLTFKILKLIE